MKVVVLDAGTLDFDLAAWAELSEFCDLQLHENTPNDSSVVAERIQGASAVFTNKVVLSAELIEGAEALKFIGTLATGYNAIDLVAAKKQGVTVCNVPTYATATTAQHTVALILELCNHVGLHNQSVHAGDWQRSPLFSYWKRAPLELDEVTIGIVGFGRIGRRVAAVLDAMGARIMASARTERDTPDYVGFRWADTETIFREADIVSLHCPQTPENTGFVDAALLQTMRPGAILVNTARGGLVNEPDLRDALTRGPIAAAGLDVLAAEPMAKDSPLIGLSNCVITPHIAWASEVARRRLLDTAIDNLRQFLAGNPVNVVSG